MKNLFWFLIFFVSFAPSLFAMSSEDKYSLEGACTLPHGFHFGQILFLEQDSRFRDIVRDPNYHIGVFHRLYDDTWGGESVYFVINDLWSQGQQRYAELFIVNCSPQSGQTVHFPVHRIEKNIQYSPTVQTVNRDSIILDDWQNIAGKSYHVTIIFDRKTSKFYHVRNEVLLQNKAIRTFVRNQTFYWDVKSYNNASVIVEVRLNEKKKKNFQIKLK